MSEFRIGGISPQSWKITQAEAINFIERREWDFYVQRPGGEKVWLVVAVSRYGNKYVKTEADGENSNNLLSLPSCP